MSAELNRRNFLQLSSAAAVGIASGSVLTSCMGTYNPKILNSVWTTKFLKANSPKAEIFKDIVRCGVMAPSGYNTQPWKFRILEDEIILYPDFSRRIPVCDPADREIYISLGCAIRNMMIGASYYGLNAEIAYKLKDNPKEDSISVKLTKSNATADQALINSMIQRQTSRTEYDKKKIESSIINKLTNPNAINSEIIRLSNDIVTDVYQDKHYFDLMIDYIKEGNRIQLGNKAHFEELKSWIRFSDSEAEEKLDGLYSRAIGQPSTARWLGKMYMNIGTTDITQSKEDIAFIRSAPVLMAFFSADTREDWLKTGILLEDRLIAITGESLKFAFHSQPCEVQGLRKDFAREFGHKDKLPQVVIRIGQGANLPRSPRRKIDDVIIGKI